MTPRRPTSSQSGTRRVTRGARPRQVPTERAASSSGAAGSDPVDFEPQGLPTTAPERVLPPRIVTLAVVCLLAFVVVFTSLRAYLSQQAQYDAVVAKIKEASDTSTSLENELAQWKDDTYVRAQVRERLGYVMPGDTSYVVVGADSVKQPGAGGGATQGSQSVPWYQALRESSQAAGQSEDSADGAAQGGSQSDTGSKTLNPTGTGLPTGAPSQAPSDPPSTSPSPAATPQTKETP
ncbi:septum formation initiator family protein [Actinomyces viscosus]|uniref:FtsB family cell division protein n=1 Tax=Actinomyces viscosus TaxID=1656 RepID=UPI0028E75EC1|nr:septum formation initiator family protein [Actinomyces viscosus]